MQFPKDIFISYAHIDDESLIEGQKGWINEFHRALDIRLAQLLGRRANIWRDPALQGNHIFDQQIVDQFEQVAVMISILTPRYVKSEWCVREANEFYDTCNKNIGFSINNQARIFKVIKTPVKVDQHPEKIRNILGYEFYTTDSTTGRLKELSQQSDKLYWEKLDDLANDIAGFLDNLEYVDASKGGNKQTGGNTTGGKQPVNIYLAESSYETKDFRDSLRRELQDNGYRIYPDKQLPLIEPVLVENVNSFLKETELAVHVIGENYGIVPEGTQKSIVEIQNEVASAASAASNLQRLIWIPEGFTPKEERQQLFVNKLNEGKDGITGADLIFSSLEDFKGIMTDKIASIEREKIKLAEKKEKEKEVAAVSNAAVTQNTGGGGSRIIYLICDMLDIDEIKPLEDFLFDNGCEVMLPIFDGEESQIREDHIENLKICDVAIIFFGNANEIWLRSKTRDFLKISGYGREKPLSVKAIYLAGASNPSKERFRSQDAEVINGMNEFPADKLALLLSKL
jgi:hypothetical protein